MHGICIHCKGYADKSSVGCKQSFVCDLCEYPCAWCNHPGPYCDDCYCININGNDCGEPTEYDCWGCEEKIPIGGVWYKCCDNSSNFMHDGRYCRNCIRICPCGDEIICNNDEHRCAEEYCEVMLCLKNALYKDSDLVYCDKHIPKFKPRVIQHILDKYRDKY